MSPKPHVNEKALVLKARHKKQETMQEPLHILVDLSPEMVY
jgi:hypothetical protein